MGFPSELDGLSALFELFLSSLTRFFRLSPFAFLSFSRVRISEREIFQARTRRLLQKLAFIPTRCSAATAHHHRVEDNQNWRGGDLRTRGEREKERRGVSFHEIPTQFPEAWPSARRYRCLIVARTFGRAWTRRKTRRRKTVLPRGESRSLEQFRPIAQRSLFSFFTIEFVAV